MFELVLQNQLVLVFLAAILTGVLVKIADVFSDHEHKIQKEIIDLLSIILGIIYGSIIALFIFNWPSVIPLVIGTFVGLLVSRKFDSIGHYFGIIVFVLISGHLYFLFGYIFEFNFVFILLIIIFSIINVLEEFVNDFLENPNSKKYWLLKKFPTLHNLLKYRLLLELTAFTISFIFNEWLIWLTIFSFDLGYHLIEKTIGKRWGKPKKQKI
jgi:hypothetical protein